MVFLKKNNSSPPKNFFLPFFNATFQCGRYNVFNFFLPMKNWKNHPKKLLRIGPDPFFPQSSPGHSPQPKINFPYWEISGPDICSLICVKVIYLKQLLKICLCSGTRNQYCERYQYWPKKVHYKAKTDSFHSFMLLNYNVQKL